VRLVNERYDKRPALARRRLDASFDRAAHPQPVL
jgi:hypothetical protein